MSKLISKFNGGGLGPKGLVLLLQEFLKSKGINPGKLDNIWGKNTERAVKEAVDKGLLSPESLKSRAIVAPTVELNVNTVQNMYTKSSDLDTDPVFKNYRKTKKIVDEAPAKAEQARKAEEQKNAKLIKKKGVVRANAEKDTKAMQEALLAKGYDLGRWGADGKWGNATQAALDKAAADGYIYEKGKLVKKPKERLSTSAIQYAAHPMFGTPLNVDVDTEGLKELKRQGTVRQYTAAQNTLEDVIKAPIKRGIGAVLGSKVANFVMPTKEYNEDHLSGELYNWLLEAIDKKWPIEERRKYFELNPDAEVKKGWHGRVNDKVKVSDYQKYYGVPYTGPMGHGIKETMFGAGIPQALGTLGSFNIVYTKDGAYIQDDWDFGVGKDFGHGNLLLVIRSIAEHLGSLENSDVEPIRKVNAFIKYK